MVNPESLVFAQLRSSYGSQRARLPSVYPLLEKAVAEHVFPGCSFGVLIADNVVALDAVGRQTYAVDAPLVLPDTIYDLASVTKVMATTAMAMLLYERDLLVLDQPLASILPGFGKEGDRGRVTLRHLLAHASGLPGYVRLFETERTHDGLMEACQRVPLVHGPGTHSEYSDVGFILLGKALEVIGGESIDTFATREVFRRCGMNNTFFNPPPALRLAIPPTEDDIRFRHRVIQGEVQDENCFVLGGVSGHAGLFGNALDVLHFAAAILQSAILQSERPAGRTHLFRPETVELFATRTELPPGSARALGWDTPSSSASGPSSSGRMFSRHSIGHLGYAGTSLWIDLDVNLAIVLLSNRTWPLRESQSIRQLRPRLYDAIRNDLKV